MPTVRDGLVQMIDRVLGMTRQGVRKRFPMNLPFAPPSKIADDRATRHERYTMRLIENMQRNRVHSSPPDDDPVAW